MARKKVTRKTTTIRRAPRYEREIVEREERNRPEREKESSPLAIISLILGIISLFSLFTGFISIIFAVAAIITGSMSLRKMRTDKYQGRGMAITGIVLGVITIILFVVFVLIIGALGLALFNYVSG
jgi:uncharacterized membrane protein HdeD (DUF308 family)